MIGERLGAFRLARSSLAQRPGGRGRLGAFRLARSSLAQRPGGSSLAQRSGGSSLAQRPGGGCRGGEAVEVAAGVCETVGVVDAQTVHESLAQPPQDLDVRRVEHLGHLHAHPRERGHREEPPVVQSLRIPPPVLPPPVLAGEHVAHDRGIRGLLLWRRPLGQRQHEVVVARRPEGRARPGIRCPGIRRRHRDFTGREHLVEVAAQDGQHDPPVAELPVDVERGGVWRRLPAQQHVPPPRVLRRIGHALMVRHDVDEDAETRRPGRVDEPGQRRLSPARIVDARRVDDVVAVRGARGRLQDRRHVRPVDPERGEVVGHGCRGIQIELRPHLQAIRRAGAGRRGHEGLSGAARRSAPGPARGRSASSAPPATPPRSDRSRGPRPRGRAARRANARRVR